MKLPAIDLQGTLGKVPVLSKFIKPKAGASASGAAKAKAAPAKSHEQEVQQRLDLTMKGLGGLALVLVLFALYSVFAQNGLNKAIHTAAPPMVDLAELAPADGGKHGSGKADHAKEAKAANNAKVKLPEGTDPRIDYAFEQIANFENTRSEAVLRSTRANVAGVAPGSVAARAGFRVGDLILSVDGEEAGFVWDGLRKLTAAGKSAVLLEVQRGNEVLRGELVAPDGEMITSSNTGLLFEIPEGYRFIGENDRRELRSGFSRAYMEGLAGDERLAYATSLALLGGNLVKRGVEQAAVKPADQMWLKTEQILADHHNKFSKALAHHGTVLESMQASLQAGFVKIGALLVAALIAGLAALAAALQLNKHVSDQGLAALRAQFQGLRSQMDQLAHASATPSPASRTDNAAASRMGMRQGAAAGARAGESVRAPERAGESSPTEAKGSASAAALGAGAAAAAGMSLAELAARVALSGDADEDKSAEHDDDPMPASEQAEDSHTANPGVQAPEAAMVEAQGEAHLAAEANRAADANGAAEASSDAAPQAGAASEALVLAQGEASDQTGATAAESAAADAAAIPQASTATIAEGAQSEASPLATAVNPNASRTGDGASA
ncbi:MAG: hypothetical protein EBQ48_03125 [Betaproteobacteria bacterium]|nr:hypothetical protein [Betaproteobacteria bacterium]